MPTVYIKFRHKEDILLLDSMWNMAQGHRLRDLECSFCGDTMYYPVFVDDSVMVTIPHGEARPFGSIENPEWIIGEPESPVTVTVKRNMAGGVLKNWLRRFPSVLSIGEDSFEFAVDEVSFDPVVHLHMEVHRLNG